MRKADGGLVVSGSSPGARYISQTVNLVLRAVWRVRVQIRDNIDSESVSRIEHKVFIREVGVRNPLD